MTATDVIELTIVVAIVVLLGLFAASLLSLRWRKYRHEDWETRAPRLIRYFAVRVGIALGVAAAFCLVLVSAITLNLHRPPGDTNPVIHLAGQESHAIVQVTADQCGGDLKGKIWVDPEKVRTARIYTDQQGLQDIPINARGKGVFELEDATDKRGLLSCYVQMPVTVGNAAGETETEMKLDGDLEVDSLSSVPVPTGYDQGIWHWRCPAGEECPTLVAYESSQEDGAKQVITLVLASLFGAIIAIFLVELLLEPVRKRLREASERRDAERRG